MMKKLNLFLIFVLIATFGFADNISITYNISTPEIVNSGEYQYVMFDGALMTGLSGEPSLPYFAISLLVPPGEIATSIKFIGEDKVSIEGNYNLYPYQNSKPLSEPYKSKFHINESVYKSNSSYPHNAMGGLSTSFLGGHGVAMSTFTPVEYIPSQGKLTYFSKVTIVIETNVDAKSAQALQNLTSSKATQSRLLKLVQNPNAVTLYDSFRNKSVNSYGLLIVTPEQFVEGFSGLTDIYLNRGIKSEIFTTEYISTNISGQDLQEKIRNFIIQEYQESEIEYVILGGDVEHIPYRGFFCSVQSGGGYSSNDIPADLYYSALDGTWDDNDNDVWGEPDEDDLLPEVAVGRYPFSNSSELAKIIHKSINYQNNPVLGELVTPLLAGEHLYSGPDTWGRDYLDLLIGERDDNGYTTIGIPDTYQIDSLYEHDGGWDGSTLMNHINDGIQFVHHVGHASPSSVAHLSSSDITNANFYGANGIDHNYTLMQTHGCDCGSFDYNDCILEKMVTIDNFAVSVIGNSRFGWFNEGQSEGPAAHLHREMVDAMYNEALYHLGSAFVESKIQTAPWVEAPGQWEEGALRWNFYDINILGDPVLSVWTNEPIDIDVDYEGALMVGVVSTIVNVTSNGFPMDNYTCSVIKDGIVYATSETDANGDATLIFDPIVSEIGDAQLIIVGQNCLPNINMISFIPAEGAFVMYNDYQIIDLDGNNNGEADFGELISLTVAVSNVGVQDALDVVATLTLDDDYITINDNTELFGSVPAGDTVVKESAFEFDVASNVPDQYIVLFNLECESGGDVWDSDFEIVVAAPTPEIGDMVVDDSSGGGNGNGQLDPGETALITITALNTGHSDCSFAEMELISNSSYLSITTGVLDLDGLNASESKFAEFTVVVDPSAPVGVAVEFECELNTCNYICEKTYYNTIGLLIEDFESGDFTSFEWHMGGDADWIVTNNEYFNGEYSSQSGNIGDNATTELMVSLHVIADDYVSFARKVSSEDNYDYLRFYIDGNMLGEWAGEEDWDVVTFDIGDGEHTLLWSFEKDGSVSSGSDCGWIDDIVFPASTTVISVEEFTTNNYFSIFPNPGVGHYTLSISSDYDVTDIVVYNTMGKVVSKPVADFINGQTDVDLSSLNSGIYFIEINTGTKKMIKKVIQR